MKLTKIFGFLTVSVLSLTSYAQVNETHWCGEFHVNQQRMQSNAQLRDEIANAERELELHTQQYIANRATDSEEVYIIPVVVHIIHNNGPENISDDQVRNAIDILTRDFRKQNSDTVAIVPLFQSIAADSHIEFRLATIDPQGNCTTGITRNVSQMTYDGYNSAMKQLNYWPRSKYLNIWVCNNAGDAAGYSQLPASVNSASSAFEDGIVMRYDYMGAIGTSNEGRSRTLTHEAGHWLNLKHLWGGSNEPGNPNNCFMDDDVADTPNTVGNTECILSMSTCDGTLDNVQNYMEYTYCNMMFTYGQRARMRAALNSIIAERKKLITESNLIATGIINPPLCVAKFESNQTVVCVGEPVEFMDKSYNAISNWAWNFGDGSTLDGTNPTVYKNPTHQYTTPGNYTVTLTVGNGTNSLTKTIENYITVVNPGMIQENLYEGFEGEWPNQLFSIENRDNGVTFEVTPSAAYNGDKSLKLRNYGNTEMGNTDILYTATFDLRNATNAQLSYKWAYTNKVPSTNDQLIISYSGDCGATWDVRRTREGMSNLMTANPSSAQFTPTSQSQWNGESLSIAFPDWLTDRFQARFEFVGKGGNNFYLDDVNITANFVIGVEEVKPLYTVGIYPNPSSENMTMDFQLQGSDDVSIRMYNATGQLCSVIYEGYLSAGKHVYTIGKQPAGLYTVVVQRGEHTAVQKIIFE